MVFLIAATTFTLLKLSGKFFLIFLPHFMSFKLIAPLQMPLVVVILNKWDSLSSTVFIYKNLICELELLLWCVLIILFGVEDRYESLLVSLIETCRSCQHHFMLSRITFYHDIYLSLDANFGAGTENFFLFILVCLLNSQFLAPSLVTVEENQLD
jgi:hypothetical protein